MEEIFLPGKLVNARDRIWVVQSGSTPDWLKLRPVGGADDEITELSPVLEASLQPVTDAKFPLPDPQKVGALNSCILLFDALRFQLRHGAGPFRSFGSIAVEPRSYQMVPLLMALRQPTVRLLIADDVGVGKTIEAGLILREMYDRGEIENFAVLCPPHLVDQWSEELNKRFNFKTAVLTSATGKKIESGIPHGKTVLDVFPFLVVSLDYIKGNRKDYFQSMNYQCIVVDEAHTCTYSTGRQQLRYNLLRGLADDPNRHMIFLTATPHSGNEEGFYNLLSLLDKKFLGLKQEKKESEGNFSLTNNPLRQELAKYFVQRRRKDISEWSVSKDDVKVGFPKRWTAEATYNLTEEWEKFFEDVRDYCRSVIQESAGQNDLIWYSILNLYHCITSSPEAAIQALNNRINSSKGEVEDQVKNVQEEQVAHEEESSSDDTPTIEFTVSTQLEHLRKTAEKLKGEAKDPKLGMLIVQIRKLLKDGFNPVVFCRYIATARYVAEALKKDPEISKWIAREPDEKNRLMIDCVTGEQVPEERRQKVDALKEAPQRVLVATDCLSEGINLQQHFNSVVHYDLSWNPTRHEQREGRVDRFGQKASQVKCLMIYGSNNPIDGFILDVIIKKSTNIKNNLGILVPIPENQLAINKAIVKADLFREKTKKEKLIGGQQMEFNLEDKSTEENDILEDINLQWTDALEKVKKTATIFAQNRVKPADVYQLWKEEQDCLGSHQDLERFCRNAARSLGSQLEPLGNGLFRIPLNTFKDIAIRERLSDENIDDGSVIDFNELHRSSNLVSILSEGLIDQAINSDSDYVSRSGVAEVDGIEKLTYVYLLRLRYQMTIKYRNQVKRRLMSEEVLPVAVSGKKNPEWSQGNDVLSFLRKKTTGNLNRQFSIKKVQDAIDFIEDQTETLRTIAINRSEEIKKQHQSVKEYTSEGSVAEVEACLPVDVMGVFVLLPNDND